MAIYLFHSSGNEFFFFSVFTYCIRFFFSTVNFYVDFHIREIAKLQHKKHVFVAPTIQLE